MGIAIDYIIHDIMIDSFLSLNDEICHLHVRVSVCVFHLGPRKWHKKIGICKLINYGINKCRRRVE